MQEGELLCSFGAGAESLALEARGCVNLKLGMGQIFSAVTKFAFLRVWSVLVVLGLACALLVWPLVEQQVYEKREEMFYALYLRSESLAWAVEGVARVAGRKGFAGDLASMLKEMGRQPGIAWIAIVSNSGQIIMDSNPPLVGQQLYTAKEMAGLKAANYLKGRFSPDDPQIFETWRSFLPQRLQERHHANVKGMDVIFVALDAASFANDLQKYRWQLWLMAFFAIMTLLSALALSHYIYHYRLSRRNLAETKALADQVIDSYPSPLLVLDQKGEVLLRNRPAVRFFQPDLGQGKLPEPPGFSWQKLFAALTPKCPLLEQELQWLLPTGELTPIILCAVRIDNTQPETTGYLVIVRELAQIRRLQQQLEESQRLSAMGKLASGIAHEIRNPLSSICGYACYLRKRLEHDPLGAATASLLEEESQRLNSALSDLLALVRKPKVRLAREDARQILEKIAALIRPDAEAREIQISIQCRQEEPPLFCDRDKLTQSLLNLALNAVQAMKQGGRLVLSGQWLARGSADIPPAICADAGCWKLDVADNGPGIAPEAMAQLFTPYFTTRADGTGLGLAMVRQIVAAHNGLVMVASLPGHGATFSIYLPGGANG